MVEFNSDGSIKMPGKLMAVKNKNSEKMKNSRCIKIRKEVVSVRAPKKCQLHLQLSERIEDQRFVNGILNYFKLKSEVPLKISNVGTREYVIEIGTNFRRCSECQSLINRYKDFVYSNVIIEEGNCEKAEKRQAGFSYEDYFD